MIQIGDVVEILSGYAFKSNLFNESGEGLPLVRIRDVGKKQSETYYSGEYSDVFLLNNGDFIIGMDGDFRLAKWEGGKALLNQRVCKITPNKEKIDPLYLYYFLPKELKKIEDVTSFATVKHLSAKDIKAISIPLPPLPEQQKIAAILDAADSLRQKDQQLVEHYTALSQSLFLEMFGDPVTNPFRWEQKKADSVIDLLTGYPFKSKDYSNNKNDIHLCGGLIITPSGIDWDKANFWDRNKLDGLERYKIKVDDIVMAMDRPWISTGFKIHKITKNDKESLLVQRTARIRAKGVNQEFLYFLFKHPAFEKQARTTETTVPHISPNDIRNYILIVPPLSLQNQFAERIQLIEAQKQQAQASLEKSETLFNSLLQRAFTGELTAKMAA